MRERFPNGSQRSPLCTNRGPFPFVIVPSEVGEIGGSTINLLRPWGFRLSFWHPRLRSLQNGISERKAWMYIKP